MFKKKIDSQEIDKAKINEVVHLSQKILKILYILIIILGVYGIIMVAKELHIWPMIKTILKVVAPLFVGILIAWLFDPIVTWFNKKGLKRGLGAALTYIIFLGILAIILWAIIPMLSNQINDFAKTIPQIVDTAKSWIDALFAKIGSIGGFDSHAMELEVLSKLEKFGAELAQSLPTITVEIIKSIFSGLGVFLIGLIIGFYLLISFGTANETILTLLPQKLRKDATSLADGVNSSLRKFVEGALIDCTLVFLVSSLGFWIVGLKAPLLFGLFCGITNIIPYAGPYIGGAPAVIVGFSQGPITGLLTLAVVVIIQFVEGNFFQPLIMSKTTKLHPVTIMLGLLIFGHFWGIIGMVISTPIIASLKAIFLYFDEKYDIIGWN